MEADSKYAMLYAGSSQDLFDAKNFHSVQRVSDPSIDFQIHNGVSIDNQSWANQSIDEETFKQNPYGARFNNDEKIPLLQKQRNSLQALSRVKNKMNQSVFTNKSS